MVGKFEPVYFKDRMKIVGPGDSEFVRNKLNVVSLFGTAGIVTLWTKPEIIWEKLRARYPRLFESSSPLVTLSSLYGNGLPQMLANLANNPQIKYLAIMGNDTPVVPSSSYLLKFLAGNVTEETVGGVLMRKVDGTSFAMDAQLKPDQFRHLEVERFKQSELERLVHFISQTSPGTVGDRVRVELIEPEFKDFPSDIESKNIDVLSCIATEAKEETGIDFNAVSIIGAAHTPIDIVSKELGGKIKVPLPGEITSIMNTCIRANPSNPDQLRAAIEHPERFIPESEREKVEGIYFLPAEEYAMILKSGKMRTPDMLPLSRAEFYGRPVQRTSLEGIDVLGKDDYSSHFRGYRKHPDGKVKPETTTLEE